MDPIPMLRIAEHGMPPERVPCIVSRGNTHTTHIAFWQKRGKEIRWILTGYAGHELADHLRPTHYHVLGELVF